MSQSRQALILCITCSLPLMIWFLYQLQFIDWNTNNLHSLFRQTLFALLLLQFFCLTILFVHYSGNNWRDELLAAAHTLFFPVPFMTLFILTGSISLTIMLKSLTLFSLFIVATLLIQQFRHLWPTQIKPIQSIVTMTHLLLAVIIWNFHPLWWDWLVL